MPEVREERSGWRDERISQRHRMWGFDCPAVDIDFLMVEYNHGKAVGLVEYKHERALPADPKSSSFRALIGLGDRARIPVFGVRYADDFFWWKVVPLNSTAREFVPNRVTVSEKEWVAILYKIRGNEVPHDVLAQCGSV